MGLKEKDPQCCLLQYVSKTVLLQFLRYDQIREASVCTFSCSNVSPGGSSRRRLEKKGTLCGFLTRR